LSAKPSWYSSPPSWSASRFVVGPIGVEDARAIAMMNGIVAGWKDVDQRWWDGNFVVEGEDGSGENMEVTIDAETGDGRSTSTADPRPLKRRRAAPRGSPSIASRVSRGADHSPAV
jgi:hypothetical protein